MYSIPGFAKILIHHLFTPTDVLHTLDVLASSIFISFYIPAITLILDRALSSRHAPAPTPDCSLGRARRKLAWGLWLRTLFVSDGLVHA